MNLSTPAILEEYDTAVPEKDAIRALLIDDDVEDAFLFSRLVSHSKQMDFSLDICRSLDAAAELLATRQYDVVYVDYWFGFETSIGFVLDETKLKRPPLIIITSLDTPDIRRCAYRAGAAGFLSKDNLSVQAIESVTLAILGAKAAPC